eukprot:CAMPEP_0178488834 /NCGR_PEP_ID=MMETSP0696-20121128/10064_1 /TAXON_ID=265572 /ORGANISM="Extubocellulus spinifer, Strain CCMP396" /LENGTH=240 /DNA_ID=CAMNT_0020116615 /DNA_START=37 /DNA_END=759 /DNA_ORIENTATION=-
MFSPSHLLLFLVLLSAASLLITPVSGQACPAQGFGIGSCFSYSNFGCTGDCVFTQEGTTCNIRADESVCPSDPSDGTVVCTCRINGQDNNICHNCATPSTDPGTVEVGPTIQSAEPITMEIPDISGPCSEPFTSMFACHANEIVSNPGGPCSSFSPEDLNNTQLMMPTSCDEANGFVCDSGLMMMGCCEDDIEDIAECLARENLGLDCDIDCDSSSGYRRVSGIFSVIAAAIVGARTFMA